MNIIAPIERQNLPALVERAASALASAKTHAEVLEAQEMASVAYAAAKVAGRLARAKEAHDSLLASVYRAQADALVIEAQAKQRLADEYDKAKADGEIGQKPGPKIASQGETISQPAKATDIIPPRQIHEARHIRDAEREDPGIIRRTVDDMVKRGEEPTKAAVRQVITGHKPKPKPAVSQRALWVWGRLEDFERDRYMDAPLATILTEMTPEMRADVRRLAPLVADFLNKLGEQA